MHSYFKCFYFVSTVIMLSIGCNKNNDSLPDDPNIPQGPLLKSYIELQYYGTQDTIIRIDYFYDSNKRVTSKTTRGYFFLLQQGVFQYHTDSTVFLYQGDLRLPYQVIDYYYYKNSSGNLEYLTTRNRYYKYNNEGLLTFDSSYFQFQGNYEKLVSNYTYIGDTIFTENRFNYYDLTYTAQNIKTRLALCDNNICMQSDTFYNRFTFPRINSGDRKIKYKYEPNINPLFFAKMQFPTWNSENNSRKSLYEEIGYFRSTLSEIDYFSTLNHLAYRQYFTYYRNATNQIEKINTFTVNYNGTNDYRTNIYFSYY